MSAHFIKMTVACLLVLGVALIFVSEGAEATTIIVDENGNGDYTKIQDAIDASSAGDKIRIWAGNYTENVDIDKRLEVIGNYTDGQHMTTINGNWISNVVNVTAERVVLEKIRVINSGNNSGWTDHEEGISIEDNWCEIKNVLVENNNYGIYVDDGIADNTLIISNSKIINNTGSGIFLKDNAELVSIENNTISDNYRGIDMYYATYAKFYYNTIVNNDQHGVDAGYAGFQTYYGNNISNNGANGINLDASGSQSGRNFFKSNIINDNGGSGIYISATANNNTFIGNEIEGNNYGIRFMASPDNLFINNVIEGDVWDILVSGNGGYSTTSHNNTFINCTFNPDSIRFDDDGTVVEQNYLEILVYDYDNLTVSGADVKIKDNSNVVYSTSYYDGDDATTDDNGLISLIPLTYTIYEYGEDPTTNVTTVEVHYRTSNVSRTVNMSTSHTENFSMPFGPEWSYETGDDVYSVAISADGEYIATGSWDDKVYLFDKDSSMLLWSYDTGNNVHSVAISADGEYIVAGNEDYKVYFFDKDSSTPLWNYTTPDQVRSVSISADGEYIVVGSWDYKVYLFDKDSSTPLWSYETGHNVNYVDISADGEYIIVGSYNKLYLFDKDSGTPLWNYSWSSGGPACIDISADGEYIAVGSYDNKAYLFDKDSSTPLWSYDTGEDVFSVSISMDGEYIAAASRDKKVYLFGKDSGTPLWSYTTGGDVWSVSISADGEYITAGSYDNKAYLFDKDSSTPLWSYTTGGDVWSVTISADGKYIAAGSFDDKVYTFKNSPASRPSLLTYGPRNGSNTDTDPQLGWFASSDDRANLTFDVYLDTNSNPTTKVAEDITTFYHNLQCLDINTKYYWKVVATDGEGSVTSSVMNFTVTSYGNIFCVSIDDDYDPAELTIIKGSTVIWTNDDSSIHTVKEDDDEFESGSILPGNSWSYTFDTVGSYNYSCQYDDDYQGQIIVLASYPPTATINSISPQIAELDGSVSFSGSGSDNDGTISEYLWNSSIDGDLSNSASFSTTDLSFGNHTITFRVKDNDGVWSDNVTSWVDVRKSPEWSYDIDDYGRCYSIAISADGEYIVVGTTSPKIHLFGKNSSTPLWSYTTGDHVEAVAISADGEYIVAGSSDDKVYLFDKDSSTPLWSYTTGDEVLSVTISADGEYIAAGSDDEKVYLFGKDSSTPLWSYSTGDNVRSVSISADGEYITAGSYDDNVYLFDKDSSTPLWNYSIGNNVYSVAISADGEYVVAGGSFGVYLFDKDSSVPFRNWDEGTDTSSKTVSISADGEYIAVATHESTVSLFDKYSNSSLWSYTAGDVVRSVSISLDGKYIAAVSHDENVYFFGKSSGTPLWSYSTGNSEWSVSISGDGKYVVSCPQDQSGSVHAFRNNPVSRPSVIPYGPSSGSLTLNDTTLGWFPGSDDITNLTFDVYMSFIYNDVANNNSAALIADDITNYTHSVTGLTESKKYYWKVVATDPSGSATSRIMNFTVGDSTAPVTDITSGPSDPSDYSNATFYFEADEDNVDFKCKIDTENWQYCSSPETYTDLSRGTYHQFKVKATDPSGNEGEPDTWIWEILDNDIPELTDYNVNPNPAEPDQRVYFYSNFSDSDGYIVDHSWTSSIDGFLSSSGNFSTDDLSAGYHSISLRAKDDDGDWSAITTFELDIEEEDTGVTPQWSYEMDGGGLSTDTSQDGQYIVVGSEDDYVYLFQSGNSTPLWSYDTGKNVNSVAISADGWSIVAGSNSNDIIFWHRNSSTPVWEYDTDSDVLFVDITADGNYVVAANEAKRIYYFNTDDDTWDSKKYIWKCEFASGGPELKSLSLADNGMSLSVALGEDLYFFDLGKVNRELNGGDESKWRTSSYDTDFISTALSSDGEYVVASTEGGEGPGGDYRNPEIRLWNRGSSNEKWSKEIDDNATTLAISANGEYIVAGCDDDKVYLFDKDSSTPLWSYDTGAKVTTVSISSDGQFILAGQEEGKLFLFNKNSGTPLWNYTNTGGSSFVSVEISKDGDIISATGEDDKVYVFNNNASSSLSVILYSPIHEERLHPDDTLRWFWNSDDESNLVFDVYLGTNSSSLSKVASNLTTSYYQPENLEVHTYYYWKVVAKDSSGTNTSDVKVLYKKWWWSYQSGRAISGVSADGEYILSGLDISGSSRGLYLFDKHSNVPLWEANQLSGSDIYEIALSADGEYIAVAASGSDDYIYFFNKDSNTYLWKQYSEHGNLNKVAISSDGIYVVGGTDQGAIYYWNKESSTPLWIYSTGSGSQIKDISISADGNLVVAATSESIYLIDGNNNSLWSYEAGDDVYVVDISSDGEYIITGDDDETIYFFSKDSNSPIWDYESDGNVRKVDISVDGEYMVVATTEVVYVFDKDSSTPLWTYEIGNCLDVHISEDGKYVAVSGYGGEMVIFWDISSSTPLWTMADTDLYSGGGSFNLDLSANGRYLSASGTSSSDNFHYFENIEASENFLLPVSPRSGNDVESPTLIWFAGSEDRSNLTFDVYLDTSTDPTTLVANDIPELYYVPTGLDSDTTYYWKVVATDSSGSLTSSIMNFYLLDDVAPNNSPNLTNYNVSPNPADYGDRVYFYTNFSDSDGYIVEYSWSSNIDGFLSSSGNFSIDDMSAGYHYIELRAKDDDGAWSDNTTFELDIEGAESSDDPIGHWKFDEGSGDIAYDNSGNNNNGTLYGNTAWVEGISGSALRFAGDSDYVEVPDGQSTLDSDVFSISLWFIWDDLGSDETQFLIGKLEEHYEIHTEGENGIMFIPAGYPDTHISVDNVIHSGWNHVVVTYDEDQSIIYFDGNIVASRNITSSEEPEVDDGSIQFGKRDGHEDATFRGVLDEITIWHRALSSEEIQELYDSYDIPVEESEEPIAYWKFDEGSGDIAYDSSGNGNDGTLKNGSVWIDGVNGTGLEFDGTDDYVVTNNGIGTISEKTLSAWVKLNDLNQAGGLITIEDPENDGDVFDSIVYNETGEGWGFGSSHHHRTNWSDISETSTDWIYIVATYKDNDYKLYRNGELICSNTFDEVYSFPSDSRIIVGKISRHSGPSHHLDAIIDEVAIWNRALSSEEIQELYDSYEEKIELPEQGFTFELAEEYDTDGSARDVFVRGDSAFIADYDEGFLILDVSNVSDINELDRYKQSGFIYSSNIEVIGNTAFVAGVSQISIYDITNPSDITEIGEYDEPDGTPWYGITVRGNLAYVAAGSDGLYILDISDITNITILDTYNTDSVSYDVEIVGDFAYVADNKALVILNISNPSDVQYVNSYSMPTSEGQCRYVTVDGNLAYVGAGQDGLLILDISNPEAITLVGSYDTDGAVVDISLVGKYVIIADYTSVLALDISDPTNPEFVTSYDTDGDAWGVDVTRNYVYVADYDYGLVVLDIVPNEIEEDVYGCMNVDASNYDSNATVDDGSCEYIEIGLPWSYETDNYVYSVDISADGEYIVAGAAFDKNIYLFDKDSNIPLWSYETGGSVNTVSISSNGEFIVAGSADRKVYVFHRNSSIPLWTYETEEVLQYYSVSISADGERIVVGSLDNKIYLFDKDSNIPLWIYETGNDIWSVDISEDGNYLVAGSLDSKVYLFSEGDSNPLWTYSTGSGVRSVSISQNGDYIIAGSGNSVYHFNKDSNTPVWNYETGGTIWGVSVSASGEHIAVSSYDYSVYFFHRDSGTPIWQYATGAPQLPTVDISSDGKYIVAGSYDSKIYLFGKDSSNPIMINGTGGMVFSVSISADGQYFTGGSSDSHVYAFRNMDWDGTNTTTDVYGCTNSTANNYNSEATVDDGSCEYEEEPVYGCTNSTATNYNSEATVDDGSCEYEEEPDTDVKTEGDFYYIPAEGETLTANLAIEYGFIVNRMMHPESVLLLDLFTPPLQPKLCLRMGSNQEMAVMDYLNENQLFVSLNSLNIEDFNIGQSNFVSQQCTVWMAPYDKLVDFNNSHPVEFERMILSETLAIVSTESKQIPVMAQYDDYSGFRTNREQVAVGTWTLTSQISSTIIINSADLWWIDTEGNDDSCEWIFEIYNNGNIMDNTTSSCTTDGSQLINSTYNINITFEVIEGDIIEIQVWYEGWDNIEFFYGSEMYPSGFYISGLELPELILGCTNTTANNYDSEATEDDGSCLFDIMDDGTSLTDIEDDEVSFSFPDNSFLYGIVTLTVGALIAAGLVESSARNSIPQIMEGLQQLIDSGITDSEINDALISLEDVDGLSYFSEDRTNALNLLTNYETMTGGALDSMAQLDELQSIVSELEASGISSPELEAEISEIESMISEQLEGDTNKDYSNTILDSFKNKEGGN